MYFILRASDDYRLIILAEGDAAQAPSPSESPPCWKYEREKKDIAPETTTRISAEEAARHIAAMEAAPPALGDWPRKGFPTLDAFRNWVRIRQREYCGSS